QHRIELVVAIAYALGLLERLRRLFRIARVEQAGAEHEDYLAKRRLLRVGLQRRGKGLCRAGVLPAIGEPDAKVVQRIGRGFTGKPRSHLRGRRAATLPARRGICKTRPSGKRGQHEDCEARPHRCPSFAIGVLALFSAALSFAFASRVAWSATFTVMSSMASGGLFTNSGMLTARLAAVALSIKTGGLSLPFSSMCVR